MHVADVVLGVDVDVVVTLLLLGLLMEMQEHANEEVEDGHA